MRRGGLVAAGTRFAYFGSAPNELRDKQDKVAAIDAAGMSATRPGRTLGDVFAALQAAYTSQGETDQWKQHHQGGMIGYASREHIATPGDPTLIEAGQAFAWNPSAEYWPSRVIFAVCVPSLTVSVPPVPCWFSA